MIEALDIWGLAERLHPFMAILHFFCDESGKYQKNHFVSVTGVGAMRPRIDPFDLEWKALLRSYGIEELHTAHFLDLNRGIGTKVRVGQRLGERLELLFPFADCINTYLEIGLMQAWSVVGYNKLPLDVKKLIGGSHDPFQIAFVRGLMEIAKFVGPGDFVNVISDDNIVTAWDTYMHYREALKADRDRYEKFVGISFAKSIHYTPLQAADMVAFLTRRVAAEEFNGTPNDCKLLTEYLFNDPKPPKHGTMRWYQGIFGEHQMVSLANRIQDAKTNGVREIQQNSGATVEGSTQSDQSQTGGGKGSEKAEES